VLLPKLPLAFAVVEVRVAVIAYAPGGSLMV
jgi:hypothetical protein